ncbi:hypothetical protein LXL04_001682 [Taraxacum kok-saghyz]
METFMSYTKLAIVSIILVTTLVTEPMATNGLLICGINIDDLKTCQPAVTKDVNPLPPPTPDCCASLSPLTGDNMPCFCNLMDSSLLNIYKIDPILAMELPRKCDLPQANYYHC